MFFCSPAFKYTLVNALSCGLGVPFIRTFTYICTQQKLSYLPVLVTVHDITAVVVSGMFLLAETHRLSKLYVVYDRP